MEASLVESDIERVGDSGFAGPTQSREPKQARALIFQLCPLFTGNSVGMPDDVVSQLQTSLRKYAAMSGFSESGLNGSHKCQSLEKKTLARNPKCTQCNQLFCCKRTKVNWGHNREDR
jgi:hypothetical protein